MRHHFVLWLLVALFSISERPLLLAAEPENMNSDVVCGPRCVKYVLDHFQRKSDLIAITKKLQWPDMDRGTDMQKLALELKESGLYTQAIATTVNAAIRWPYPAIVFFRNPRDVKALGHFAVLLPESTDDEAIFWNGLVGIEHVSWTRLNNGEGVVALLVSPEPITQIDAAIVPLSKINRVLLVCYAFLAVVVGVFVLRTMRTVTAWPLKHSGA